jgi:hypothetical protein
MKKVLQKIGTALMLVPAMLLGISMFAAPALAVQCNGSEGYTLVGGVCVSQGDNVYQGDLLSGSDSLVRTIINIFLYVVGILSVAFIIFAGVRYVTSGGDQNKVKSAKDTLLYAIIGLIVAILGWAIVNLVVDWTTAGGSA